MKNFLTVYLGTEQTMAKWTALDEKTRKQRESDGIKAWMAWAKEFDSQIVDPGSPLGKTKHIAGSGISDTKNNLAAYTIIRAESHEAAAKIFRTHPHFTFFPGESVEVMECLPLPKM